MPYAVDINGLIVNLQHNACKWMLREVALFLSGKHRLYV